jgi:hypothetical protein
VGAKSSHPGQPFPYTPASACIPWLNRARALHIHLQMWPCLLDSWVCFVLSFSVNPSFRVNLRRLGRALPVSLLECLEKSLYRET